MNGRVNEKRGTHEPASDDLGRDARLPWSESGERPLRFSLGPGGGASPPTVLIVEDDDETRRLLREALEDEGYRVVTAGDGQAAFDLLLSEPVPDLILLDLLMPGMSGWEVLTKIRKDPELARIPVTVMSGLENADAIEDARFLQKPFNLGLLLRLVREDLALARWRTGR